MFTATGKDRVTEVFTECGSDSMMVIREQYSDGKQTVNYVPFAAWTDVKAFEQAAKKVFRLAF